MNNQTQRAAPEAVEELKLISAEELYYKQLTQPKLLIDGLLPNGLAVLSGDSKIGKSWLVLWLCLQISRGEPVWGRPTRQCGVVYLALEDTERRIQKRMIHLIDEPPANMHISFHCGTIGESLEIQIRKMMAKYPDTGIIFIDTLQLVRNGKPSSANAYEKDYKDLAPIKALADEYDICIFMVHHTRKEKDKDNVFNNSSGSVALTGAADTSFVLDKENYFDNRAVLSITGRDVENRQMKLVMKDLVWEVTEDLNAEALARQQIPDFILQVAGLVLANRFFVGTMTDLLARVNNTEVKPNAAKRILLKFYGEVFEPLKIKFRFNRTAEARIISMWIYDDPDDPDGKRKSEFLASLAAGRDITLPLPETASQPSLPSPKEPKGDDGFRDITPEDDVPFDI